MNNIITFIKNNNYDPFQIEIQASLRMAWNNHSHFSKEFPEEFISVFNTMKLIDKITGKPIVEFLQTADVYADSNTQWHSLESINSNNLIYLDFPKNEQQNFLNELMECYTTLTGKSLYCAPRYMTDRFPSNIKDFNEDLSIDLEKIIDYKLKTNEILKQHFMCILKNKSEIDSNNLIKLHFDRFKMSYAYKFHPIDFETYKLIKNDHTTNCLERHGSMEFQDYFKWYCKSLDLFEKSSSSDDLNLSRKSEELLNIEIQKFLTNPKHNEESIGYWIHKNFEIHPMHQAYTQDFIDKCVQYRHKSAYEEIEN